MSKKFSKTDLAWLAGIIDGEGCIWICRHYVKTRGYLRFIPFVQITNTNFQIIEKSKKILDALGISYYNQSFKYSGEKEKWDIKIGKRDQVKKILESLLPHLVGKKDQGVVMLDYLQQSDDLIKHKRDVKNQKFISMSSSDYRDFSDLVYNKLRTMKK